MFERLIQEHGELMGKGKRKEAGEQFREALVIV